MITKLENSSAKLRWFIYLHGPRIMWTAMMVCSLILLTCYSGFWNAAMAWTGLTLGICAPTKEVILRWAHKF